MAANELRRGGNAPQLRFNVNLLTLTGFSNINTSSTVHQNSATSNSHTTLHTPTKPSVDLKYLMGEKNVAHCVAVVAVFTAELDSYTAAA